MTRARDLSKLLGANNNGVIPNNNVAVDLSNLSATNLTSGTVASSRLALVANDIPSLDTAKITTGTFADARISQSSVSQHATSFDDSKIQQDLMVLALQQATDANKSAYNLSNSFVEQFEDATGIDVHTNTTRSPSEFVHTETSNISYINTLGVSLGKHNSTFGTLSNSNWASGTAGLTNDRVTHTGQYDGYFVNFVFDLSKDFSCEVYSLDGSGNFQNQDYLAYFLLISADTTKLGANPSNVFKTDNSGANVGGVFGNTLSTYRSNHITASYDGLINAGSITKVLESSGSGSNSINSEQLQTFVSHYHNDGSSRHGWRLQKVGSTITVGIINSSRAFVQTTTITNVRTTGSALLHFGDATSPASTYYSLTRNGGALADYTQQGSNVFNATGNFTSVSQTAPATVSKMGIVALYKNNAGTATLNTDLVAQLSANNGTNFTTVTLTPRGTFSTGINIAVANNVTVTSGTSVKYKLSFANQGSGTKETQVHGVGLIY